jgi:integrase
MDPESPKKIAARGRGTIWYDEKHRRYRGKISLADGSRPTISCPPGPKSKQAEERARERIASRAEVARTAWKIDDVTGERRRLRGEDFGIKRRGAPATSERRPLPEGVESATDWFGRFHKAKEGRGLSSVGDMRGRAKKWILPALDNKTMTDVTREDLESIVRRLDEAVAAFQAHGPGAGRLSPSTAANVWGDLQHALEEACSAKDPALRVLPANPAQHVRGPETGAEREGQILYSDELLALLAGKSVRPDGVDVPMYRRRCYAMAVYTKARSSELEALTKSDVDFAHGTITISKQVDRAAKATETAPARTATKQTKTKRARTIDIEPNLRPLVEALVECPAGQGGRLVHMPPPEDRAELLRKDLRTVGVTREALFVEHDPIRRSIVFHDLRDTGLTHMAVRGDSPIVIQWAGGHTDFKTTQGYIDRGRVEARRIGAPLPPLPPDLVPPTSRNCPEELSEDTGFAQLAAMIVNSATPTGIEPVLPT